MQSAVNQTLSLGTEGDEKKEFALLHLTAEITFLPGALLHEGSLVCFICALWMLSLSQRGAVCWCSSSESSTGLGPECHETWYRI